MRVIKFLTDMRKRDLLLIGFIGLFVLLIGVLTGYIPSPVLVSMAQHTEMLKNQADGKQRDDTIIEIGRLQLYLQREECMHGSKTESERARCDRQSVRDAILGDILPTDSSGKSTTPLEQ